MTSTSTVLGNFLGACQGHTPTSRSTEVFLQNVAAVPHRLTLRTVPMLMTPVGFEPTQLALVELESTPLDHSGKVSLSVCKPVTSELLLARS